MASWRYGIVELGARLARPTYVDGPSYSVLYLIAYGWGVVEVLRYR